MTLHDITMHYIDITVSQYTTVHTYMHTYMCSYKTYIRMHVHTCIRTYICTLLYVTLQYTAVHTSVHYTALHCYTLHCTTLHTHLAGLCFASGMNPPHRSSLPAEEVQDKLPELQDRLLQEKDQHPRAELHRGLELQVRHELVDFLGSPRFTLQTS